MAPPEPAEGSDIIIKGGSCEIQFDQDVFQQDPANAKRRKHDTLKINESHHRQHEFRQRGLARRLQGEIRITVR